MTVNHCLFLVQIDNSIIFMALHFRIKLAATILLRSDFCVVSKLELIKNALKSGATLACVDIR